MSDGQNEQVAPLTSLDFVKMWAGAFRTFHHKESIHCRMRRPEGVAKDAPYRCPACDAESILRGGVDS